MHFSHNVRIFAAVFIEMSRKELTMKSRRIIMTCFAAIILMMALPVDVLATVGSTTNAKGEGQARRDRLTDISRKEDHRPVAVFEDTMNTMRICLTRPQRLLPSHGAAPGKTQVRSMESRRYTTPLCNYQIRSSRQESTPFQSSVSRNYYVIALRHIIC